MAETVVPDPMSAFLTTIAQRDAKRDANLKAALAERDAERDAAFNAAQADCDARRGEAQADRDAAVRRQTRRKIFMVLMINLIALPVALMVVLGVGSTARRAVAGNAERAHHSLFAVSPGAICAYPYNNVSSVPIRKCDSLIICYADIDRNVLSDAVTMGLTPLCATAVDLNDSQSLLHLMSAMQECSSARFLSEQLDHSGYDHAGYLNDNTIQLQPGVPETILQYYFNSSIFDFSEMHFLPSRCDDLKTDTLKAGTVHVCAPMTGVLQLYTLFKVLWLEILPDWNAAKESYGCNSLNPNDELMKKLQCLARSLDKTAFPCSIGNATSAFLTAASCGQYSCTDGVSIDQLHGYSDQLALVSRAIHYTWARMPFLEEELNNIYIAFIGVLGAASLTSSVLAVVLIFRFVLWRGA